MKIVFQLSLIILVSCGGKSSSVNYGKTTRADLVAMKGEPIKETTAPVKDTQILLYDDEEKFQVQNDIVTHQFKNPKGDEKTLIYWKHRFKDCDTQTNVISKASGHVPAEYEMSCASEGL